MPIMSLQTGSQLAVTSMPIIDPSDLSIVATYVDGPRLDQKVQVLFMTDIREIGDVGIIVDDSSKIMGLDSLVRLQSIIDEDFTLIGCQVVDRSGKKYGKVNDYAFDSLDFKVQQLFSQSSFLKNLVNDTRIINRKQVIDVSHNTIVIDIATEGQVTENDKTASLINPFRPADTEAH